MPKPPEPDLVCFSHLRWDFVFQRPHHLMTRWARDRRVFFFEEPSPKPSDRARLELRLTSHGVHLVTPHLPAGADTATTIAELLPEFFRSRAIRRFVSWYYSPLWLESTSALEPAAIVYDCMDELSGFRNASPRLKVFERELCRVADLVFTGGQSLFESKRFLHRSVHAFPSAVDIAHFAKARTPEVDPPDQADIPHPRLGFFGVIDERMDLDLVEQLAERRPDWHIVLVGPITKIDPESVPKRPNIHLLGSKPYEELPAYLGGWDVALLPFAHNEATHFISPTKTPEYLAGGRPVVSTSIRDVVRPYGELGLAEIADTAEEFESCIEFLLSSDSAERRRRADEFLAGISWDQTWSAMKSLVDAAVGSSGPPGLAGDGAGRGAAMRGARGSRDSVGIPAGGRSGVGGTSARLSAAGSPAMAQPARPCFDVLVVGAGFAGSVVAERLASRAHKKVLLCDVRPHIAGNAYDYRNSYGLLVHRYGPHIFHTNSPDVFQYLSQFTTWRPYEHRVLACVESRLLPIPINLDTVNRLYGWNLDSQALESYLGRVTEAREKIVTSEDSAISRVGRDLYEKFFRNYTRKQWGLDPSELDAAVLARIPVRTDHDDRYFTDKYQAMPADGMTAMFTRMLDHPNITLALGIDYRRLLGRIRATEIIYTGPVDEYFDCCYGKLPYRALAFSHETLDEEIHQPVAVVNYPNEYDYTRVTEFKHLTGQQHRRTSIVYEYPCDEGDPYYPVPRPENARLYARYEALAQATPHVHFCGRLATYRYYNMDQVVAQSLTLASRLLGMQRKQLLAYAS
ncbi:MAG TPA: UDP-galactopyranose mutase [Candidatus Binatia bacterium]|jgi:UDP-galactopyranose mutase